MVAVPVFALTAPLDGGPTTPTVLDGTRLYPGFN